MAGFNKVTYSTALTGAPVMAPNGVGNIATLHSSTPDGNNLDEIWLWAVGIGYGSSITHLLTVTHAGQAIPVQIIGQSPPQLVIPGLILAGTGAASSLLQIYADAATTVLVMGYVNRIVQ